MKGRLAFYLAVTEPEQAAVMFEGNFEDAPSMDRTACRLWLSSLVLRRSDELDALPRVLAFFRGFQLYTENRRRDAADEFRKVLIESREDRYHAISEHLLAVCLQGAGFKEPESLLRSSVALSEQLGIGVNEVMARHSLTWLLVGARDRNPALLVEAEELSELNLKRAAEQGDKGLYVWCLRAKLVVAWLALQEEQDADLGAPARAIAAAPDILSGLAEVAHIADALDDLQTHLTALNDAASICADLGWFPEARTFLVDAVERVSQSARLGHEVKRLAQTTGRLRRLADSAGERQAFAEIIARLKHHPAVNGR